MLKTRRGDMLYSQWWLYDSSPAPWYENLNKRQVKAPKIYLRDGGLFHGLSNGQAFLFDGNVSSILELAESRTALNKERAEAVDQTPVVRILISDVSVRWTGQRVAICKSLSRWVSSRSPSRRISL